MLSSFDVEEQSVVLRWGQVAIEHGGVNDVDELDIAVESSRSIQELQSGFSPHTPTNPATVSLFVRDRSLETFLQPLEFFARVIRQVGCVLCHEVVEGAAVPVGQVAQ